MRLTVLTAALALSAAAAMADDARPSAIGHLKADGKMWRVEGCAAYPVEAQSTPAKATLKMTPKPDAAPKKLASTKKN